MYDFTGTYDATFFVGGSFIIFAGILLLWVPVYRYIRRRRTTAWRLAALNIDETIVMDDIKPENEKKTSDKEDEDVEACETTCSTSLLPHEAGLKPPQDQIFTVEDNTNETTHFPNLVEEQESAV